MRRLMLVSVLAGALAYATSASGVSLNYSNFASTAGLKLNGDAAKVADDLRVVPALGSQEGSAFTNRKVLDSRRSFKTKFKVELHDGSGNPADGFAFLMHNQGKGALGDGGGGIGYGGITGSVAVEFDTFQNIEGDDPLDDHVAVHRNGNAGDSVKTGIPGFEIYGGDGNFRWAWIEYSAKKKKLKVFLNDESSKPGAALVAVRGKLSRFLADKVRVGFTAATGGDFQAVDILSWSLKQKRRR